MHYLLAVGLLIISTIHAHATEKPIVGIKEAKISDAVSSSVKPYLNLGKLLAEMEASFLATRKFGVVSRDKEAMGAVREEQKFAGSDLSENTGAQEGKMKNADYLILPEVHRFAFYTKTHKVPNLTSKYFRTDHGTLELNAQVIDTETGQITTTFFLKDSFSTKEIMVNKKGGVPNRKHFTDLAKGISAQMADQFLDLVFPVEIISLKGTKVYLNRGKDGGFKVGDMLKVFYKGEELIDPHTGEQLGSAEEYIGMIKVARVNPKFTIATVVQDKMEGDISVGCIVRKP